jgi:acyl dehydratase
LPTSTGDYQWIRVDVERAKTGPFGGPIVQGYLTLSSLGSQLFDAGHGRYSHVLLLAC